MKRLIFIAASILTISSCASAAGTVKPPDLDIPFSAEAEITYNGEDCAAQLRRYGSGNWEFSITEPYALEGLTITLRSDHTTLSMYDLESSGDEGDGAVSMARAASAAYDAAVASGEPAASGDGVITVSGSSELGACSLTLDQAAAPALLTSDAGRLSVKLSSFTPPPPSDVEAELVE